MEDPITGEPVEYLKYDAVDDGSQLVNWAGYTLPEPKPEDDVVSIHNSDGPMVTIRRNGTIEFGSHYTPDEASKIFWDAILSFMPDQLRRD